MGHLRGKEFVSLHSKGRALSTPFLEGPPAAGPYQTAATIGSPKGCVPSKGDKTVKIKIQTVSKKAPSCGAQISAA
jgi:hypothetical protein